MDGEFSDTCGEALVALLEAYGVDTVFGIPGVHNLELYRGLAGTRIRHILPRHEQGAGFMADGYARVTGKPGVCFVITGAGVTNIATPMGQAFSDSVPMLVLSSENPRESLGKGYGCLHEITDQAAVTRPLCAFSETPQDPEAVPGLIARAFDVFAAGRPRPVHLSLPLDMLAEPVRQPWTPRDPMPKPAPDPELVEEAATLLQQAARPLILAGGGARGAAAQIQQLAEALDCPVLATVAAKDLLPAEHPLFLGSRTLSSLHPEILGEADLLLAVGTELSDKDSFEHEMTLPPQILRIDIDPAEFDRRYRWTVALRADAEIACEALLTALGPLAGERDGAGRVRDLMARPHHGFLPELEGKHLKVLGEVAGALPDGAVVAGDMTQVVYTACGLFDAPRGGRFLFPDGYGTLGYALPAATGAKIGAPERAVLAIAGDSGVLYTAPEMAVAAELGLNLVLLVWNNRALGQIRDDMVAKRIQTVGVTPAPPDFEALAKAFGWSYARPDSVGAIGPALKAGFLATGPTLVEVADGIEGL
jgi:5-guanidino-2-oxopentanoate decarboxylase